ncbi:MAG: agmatine deiminase family protein [Actinomycetota bacterium]
MCWPTREGVYEDRMGDARRAHASVARTISGFEPVTMIVNENEAENAATMCGKNVEVVALPIDDSWFRDTGPIYVSDGYRREDAAKPRQSLHRCRTEGIFRPNC